MSFLGMGSLEVIIVLLVAFIFLGPERMVDAGRMLGKAVREVRKLTDQLPDLTLDEPVESPIVHRHGGPRRPDSTESDEADGSPQAENALDEEGSPVSFRALTPPEEKNGREPEDREERA